jgi:hypothetical protein
MSDEYLNNLSLASVEDIKSGFYRDKSANSFICLFCGQIFETDVIYQAGELQVVAQRAANYHVDTAHGGSFAMLLGLGSQHTGVSGAQEAVLRRIYAGQSDREIAAALGNKSESTVRNQRFQLRRRQKEAKLFIALMELLEERDTSAPCFMDFHADIPVQDDRVIVTSEERDAVLRKHFSEEDGLKLLSFPRKQKAKLIVLNRLAELFEKKRNYTEADVNAKLEQAGDMTGEIRRYLIDYGFLDRKRDGSAYWRT